MRGSGPAHLCDRVLLPVQLLLQPGEGVSDGALGLLAGGHQAALVLHLDTVRPPVPLLQLSGAVIQQTGDLNVSALAMEP